VSTCMLSWDRLATRVDMPSGGCGVRLRGSDIVVGFLGICTCVVEDVIILDDVVLYVG
jgi:hypothetical protein